MPKRFKDIFSSRRILLDCQIWKCLYTKELNWLRRSCMHCWMQDWGQVLLGAAETNTVDVGVIQVQEAVHGVTIEQCQAALQNHNWNVQKAVHYLKVRALQAGIKKHISYLLFILWTTDCHHLYLVKNVAMMCYLCSAIIYCKVCVYVE